jgi:hypothetical protein
MTDQEKIKREIDAHMKGVITPNYGKGSGAAPYSLPKYLERCQPPFFRSGWQIFGKDKITGDAVCLDIRGWGRLTGAMSGYTEDEACAMQDEFGDWVVNAMNAAAENAANPPARNHRKEAL